MTRHVLLIHGWSAEDDSMRAVGELLAANDYQTRDLFLGGYPSMDDVVRIEDAARRMRTVILDMQADGRLPDRFHLIVHSTGALVARRWLADNHPEGGGPVANFLMLAPANFGSPLAAFGRSMLARIVKGWKRGFQTGTEFLHGLELGSQFQEDLALCDRLSTDGSTGSPFSEDGTRPFVIVGATPIMGTQITGERAWDGTVRIASANIDPRGVTVDFTQGTITKPKFTPWTRRGPGETPFAVIPDRTHLSILRPDAGNSGSQDPETAGRLKEMILAALAVETPDDYRALAKDWQAICGETRKLAQDGPDADALRERIFGSAHADRQRFNEFYQVVADVRDDTGLPVDDFELWLTAPKRGETVFRGGEDVSPIEIDARLNLIQDDHANTRHRHRRVLHVDRRALMWRDGFFRGALSEEYEETLAAGITASAPGSRIAYFSRDSDQASALIQLRALNPEAGDESDRFLRRYTTHFLRVIVPRVADDDVFTVRPLG
ncbi:triacylglycerol lipase [Maricaulis sp.]|uniref:esterase/lipase family protein n=1 Tax=Maricaulis sp. TaxID=1486257 RepID=UPI0026306F25|nr:alpha/beta hydrolase [Maricaulis sp.]